jgi:histidinol-phosphate aminotransferase
MFRPEIQAMRGYVPGEQPQAGKFIKLNTNENPYPPSRLALQAIRDAASSALARYPDPLANSFRISAAELYDVDPDMVLCGNGSDDILTIVTRACVGQGQRLRLPYPSYVLYRTLAQLQGAQWQEVPFNKDWSLSPAFSASDGDLKLVFLPNPNSPSGTMIPPSQVLQLAEQLPCPLLVDEAYAEFAATNCISLVKQCEKILVSRTLSKSYGLAGLRFGYLIAQPQIVQQLSKVKDSYNCDALSIAAATAAIGDQNWLEENRSKIIASRERLYEQLCQVGFSVLPSQANFLWCTHAERSLEPVYQQLKSARILVRYMKYPDWGEGLRISVGTDEQNDALITMLKAIWNDG